MNAENLSKTTSEMIFDTFKKVEEFNKSKKIIYENILLAYKIKDLKLLEENILNSKKLILQQKIFYDKVFDSIDAVYTQLSKEIKVISEDKNFLQRIISNKDREFDEYTQDIIYWTFKELKENISAQNKIFDKYTKKNNSLEYFFEIKNTLNELYRDEIEYFFTINQFYNNEKFQKYKENLYEKLEEYNKEINKKINDKRKKEIVRIIEAIQYVIFFIDVFIKVKINNKGTDALYNKIEAISERLAEKEYEGSMNNAINIATTAQTIQTIMRR